MISPCYEQRQNAAFLVGQGLLAVDTTKDERAGSSCRCITPANPSCRPSPRNVLRARAVYTALDRELAYVHR